MEKEEEIGLLQEEEVGEQQEVLDEDYENHVTKNSEQEKDVSK